MLILYYIYVMSLEKMMQGFAESLNGFPIKLISNSGAQMQNSMSHMRLKLHLSHNFGFKRSRSNLLPSLMCGCHGTVSK